MGVCDNPNSTKGRLSRRDVLVRGGFLGLAIASLSLAKADHLAEAQTGTPKRGGTLRFGMETNVFSLDPHNFAGSGQDVLNGMTYGRLVQLKPDWSGFEPDLAQRWEVAPDGKAYTFFLRPNVKFHDGSALTADDVVYSFQRIMDKATGAYVAGFLSDVFDQVSASDAGTVRFVLKTPFAAFLSILALPTASIVSKAWITKGGNVTTSQMGTGPMKFVSMEPNSKITLTRNTQYFENGIPYLDGITILFLPDDTTRSTALRSGSVDMIDYVPWKDMTAMSHESNLRLYTDATSSGIWAVANVRRPPLDNVLVRQALNWAMDRNAMLKVAFFGHGANMLNIFMPKTSWAYTSDLPAYGYDPNQAKALIKKSGIKMPQTLDILSDSDDLFWKTTSEVMQANLRDIGFEVRLATPEFGEAIKRENAMDFQIGMYGGGPAYADPDFLYTYFDSKGARGRLTGYVNPALDDLLQRARTTPDQNTRKGLYVQAYKILMNDAPWFPLNYREQGEAAAISVQGYQRVLGTNWNGVRIAKTWLSK